MPRARQPLQLSSVSSAKGQGKHTAGCFALMLLIKMEKWVLSIQVVPCMVIRYFFVMCKNEIHLVPKQENCEV